MSDENPLVGKVIDQSNGVLEKAYDDLVHPTAKSAGNTISLIPRTIGVWLSKWEKWVINGEESIRLTAQAVQEKVSNIPQEKLTEPEPYVAIPAVQQLSYCYDSNELRELYANLLVSSMNSDKKKEVHPAFVDIIKQLAPDEARLLKLISGEISDFPLIDLQITNESTHGYFDVIRNFTSIGDEVCESPSNICAYIENLDRLKLICILEDNHLTNETKYTPLENAPTILSYRSTPLAEGHSYTIHKKLFLITDFGKAFIKTCVI